MRELILKGTKNRLRPVMLTAGAAAMGFLPMAISNGAGAEIQRPLATVVIGGLFTSTLLTMIALPLLFEIFYNIKGFKLLPFKVIRSKTVIILALISFTAFSSGAQTKQLSLTEIIDIAIVNSREIGAAQLKVEESKVLKSTGFALEKTAFTYGTDQNNIAENGHPLNVAGVVQGFSFPTLYSARTSALKIDIQKAELMLEIQKAALKKEISLCYFAIQQNLGKIQLYKSIDSLYTVLLKNATLRFEKGNLSQLDMLSIKARQQAVKLNLGSFKTQHQQLLQKLKMLMNYNEDFSIPEMAEVLPTPPDSLPVNAFYQLVLLQDKTSEAMLKIEKNKLLPDFSLNYFVGSNKYQNSKYYHGFEVELAMPLIFGGQQAQKKSSEIALNAQQLLTQNEIARLKNRWNQLKKETQKYSELIAYYNETGKLLYDEILRATTINLQSGETDLFKFTYNFETAVQIKIDYLDNLLNYNTLLLEQMYLSN
jgi:cobalt-zinc-cadmium resistance protein CzcA